MTPIHAQLHTPRHFFFLYRIVMLVVKMCTKHRFKFQLRFIIKVGYRTATVSSPWWFLD